MSNIDKFKKAIAGEKASISNKVFSIDQNSKDKFVKASEFLSDTEEKVSTSKSKLIKNSFLLPEQEYEVVTNAIKILINHGIIAKQTDVFRIALSILNNTPQDVILNAYKNLIKITPGKQKE